MAALVVDMFGSKSTAVMTNVVGPKQPVYFAGHRMADMMFWVPQSGRMGLGVSIFSYDGHVVVGVATDAGLVPDPERIATFFEDELDSLRASPFSILDEVRAAAPERRKKPWRKTPPASSSATPSPRSRTAAGKRPAARRKASKR